MLRETHKDIERHRETHRVRKRHRETQRDTGRHTEAQGDTHSDSGRDTQRYAALSLVCLHGWSFYIIINQFDTFTSALKRKPQGFRQVL